MATINVTEAVIDSIRRLGCDADQILPVHELQYDLGIDSTEMIELAALVQNQFRLESRRICMGSVKTVSDLVAQVESLISVA